MLEAGHWMLDADQDAGHWMLDLDADQDARPCAPARTAVRALFGTMRSGPVWDRARRLCLGPCGPVSVRARRRVGGGLKRLGPTTTNWGLPQPTGAYYNHCLGMHPRLGLTTTNWGLLQPAHKVLHMRFFKKSGNARHTLYMPR